MTPLEQAHYLTEMMGMGYTDIKPIRGGEYWTGLMHLLYTTAIVVGKMGDHTSVYDRWCYHDKEKAKISLDNWDGNGEPDGWHRHPGTGRRRQNGLETINF